MNILQIGPLSDRFNEALAARHDVKALWRAEDQKRFVDACAADIEMVVTSSRFGARQQMLERLPRLKAVCSFGVGYDAIDVAWAKAHGVVVSNTPDVLTDCVADLALGLMLASARRIPFNDRFVRDRRWGRDAVPLGRRVSGKRLGIVGLGRIGMAIAKRAAGFDLQIAYTGPQPMPHAAADQRYEPSLTALAEWADFLVLSCVGGASTYRIVSTSVLDALGAKGTLINVSRGSVVDETALVAALVEGRLGAAALDVFEAEPALPEALLALDNVVLLPHVASGTVETRRQMEDLLADNVEAFSAGGRLLNAV